MQASFEQGMIGALRFKISNESSVTLYPAGAFDKIDWKRAEPCAFGPDFEVFLYQEQQDGENIVLAERLDGKPILRLKETRRYTLRCEGIGLPRLQNEDNRSLHCDRDRDTITFQFINYLGRSKMIFEDGQSFPFEVVPDKMDYEDDYIELTEAIAEKCSELLLDYAGPTSNVFRLSEENAQTLLEQFIFLRRFCYRENIRALFEAVRRNPDRILVEKNEFNPIGCGMPSQKVYTHPFAYARNWNRYASADGGHYHLPSQVVASQKRDSLDTPANRFLRYALERFYGICEELILALGQDGSRQGECCREAEMLHEELDTILHDHFFDEVGPMDILPQNNQVLQKREGYSQIFLAYSMVDLALQLDWKGEESVYEGESKNVALLYEYWLFFELEHIIGNMDGCKREEAGQDAFRKFDKGKLILSLKSGKESCQHFSIPRLGIKVNLYYNRTFSPKEFCATEYEGSYSRPFRPDYTLAIFPAFYHGGKQDGEDAAVRDGAVSYIHFDAKYRITDLSSLIGKEPLSEAETSEELDEEKAEEVANTYKRGDLLKMHTYNDAIRRTVGSYVLYPGDGNDGENHHAFRIYDEILPGVGAFAIKPSIQTRSEDALRGFILDLIHADVHRASRLNRLNYYSEAVLQEPSLRQESLRVMEQPCYAFAQERKEELCVIGFIRRDYYLALEKTGRLEEGKEFLFYYHAIKDGIVYSHHPAIARAKKFRFFTNRSTGRRRQYPPILCKIGERELLSKEQLIKALDAQGCHTTASQHHAEYYYTMKVRVISTEAGDFSLNPSEVDAQNGNDSFSPYSPKVLPAAICLRNGKAF